MKILTIGDPHFKKDNANETSLMITKLRTLILNEKPSMIVVLGDIGHDFDDVGTNRTLRMHDFLNMLHETMSLDCKLYLLIGNHDRVHNKVFMTNEHVFNAHKKWERTHVIDSTYVEIINDKKYVFVPYVETGKFNQALATNNLCSLKDDDSWEYNMENVTLVFAHQEFFGAKMNAITSNKGDLWPNNLPLCISGHIHDYEQLQNNLIYVGTPIQHGYSDTKDKTVSIFTLLNDEWEHRRINLGIPKKLHFTLNSEQILSFQPPENAQIKIKLRGTAEEVKNVMNLKQIKDLIDVGVKIKEDIIIQKITISRNITKKDFKERLSENISTQPEKYKHLFEQIFQ